VNGFVSITDTNRSVGAFCVQSLPMQGIRATALILSGNGPHIEATAFRWQRPFPMATAISDGVGHSRPDTLTFACRANGHASRDCLVRHRAFSCRLDLVRASMRASAFDLGLRPHPPMGPNPLAFDLNDSTRRVRSATPGHSNNPLRSRNRERSRLVRWRRT
jgi:hypothetical protein